MNVDLLPNESNSVKKMLKVPIAPNYGKVFVYKIQVNSFHTVLKYGDYYDFIDM